MTATDLHQRMLHQLDRVKALNTSPGGTPPQGAEQNPHVSQRADASAEQPHIPAITDEQTNVVPQETFTDDDDDRGEPRPEVQQHGLVIFAGHEQGMACEIMDLTQAGARLRLAEDVTVPSCFQLTIQPENTAKTAQVCWRNDQELGIQFIDRD
ncbi:MAG: PilZ domain-containing protein [Pseudomonadota bacterium]